MDAYCPNTHMVSCLYDFGFNNKLVRGASVECLPGK